MKYETSTELIDAYLNKVEFVTLDQVELPSYEWGYVREYCFDNSKENPDLSALLANMYLHGYGVNVDYLLAKLACESAIKRGSVNAIFTMGLMYHDGKGVLQSYEEAVKFYQEAADKGLWRAKFRLGVCYSVPRGVKQDHQKAFEYFMEIAKLGYVHAQFNVARYIYREKVEYANRGDCIIWFHSAAEQNSVSSMEYLGDIYYNGYHAKKNLKVAFTWYQKALQHKSGSAAMKMAPFFEKGMVVDQSYKLAYDCYLAALELGFTDAKPKIREYESNRCPHCHAFYTKIVVKKLFGEKTICSACKKNYYIKYK